MKAFKAGALFALGFITVRVVAIVTGAVAIAVLEKTAEKPAETVAEPLPVVGMDALMDEAEAFLNTLLTGSVSAPTDDQIYNKLVALRDASPTEFADFRDGECLTGPACRVHIIAREMVTYPSQDFSDTYPYGMAEKPVGFDYEADTER